MKHQFLDFAQQTKAKISAHIASILHENQPMFSSITSTGEWLASEMEDFAESGKMLRGSLAILGAQLLGVQDQHYSISLAAGLELLQAGLLIHDDIMDHDEKRRGKPTFHIRIRNKIQQTDTGFSAYLASQLAEAQSICAGDLFFFLGWQELAYLPQRVSFAVAQEHAKVTLAQMQDVAFGYARGFPDISSVIEMYRHKTARYTVALPLMAGALLLDNCASEVLKSLEAIGESLGIVFQLQDDRLGIFGDEAAIGKPIGSDLKEGKKTPYILALAPQLSESEMKRFNSMFRAQALDPSDLEWVRFLIISKGVDAKIQSLINDQIELARKALADLWHFEGISKENILLLGDFIDYSLSRER